MDICGYGTGPVTADTAFTSDFAIPDDIPMQNLVDMVEIERRSMDLRPGMRHKLWLPESRLAGGAPSAYPAAPVHPLPKVAEQQPA
jgi:hypothetical protein